MTLNSHQKKFLNHFLQMKSGVAKESRVNNPRKINTNQIVIWKWCWKLQKCISWSKNKRFHLFKWKLSITSDWSTLVVIPTLLSVIYLKGQKIVYRKRYIFLIIQRSYPQCLVRWNYKKILHLKSPPKQLGKLYLH